MSFGSHPDFYVLLGKSTMRPGDAVDRLGALGRRTPPAAGNVPAATLSRRRTGEGQRDPLRRWPAPVPGRRVLLDRGGRGGARGAHPLRPAAPGAAEVPQRHCAPGPLSLTARQIITARTGWVVPLGRSRASEIFVVVGAIGAVSLAGDFRAGLRGHGERHCNVRVAGSVTGCVGVRDFRCSPQLPRWRIGGLTPTRKCLFVGSFSLV